MTRTYEKSHQYFAEACQVLPGGVNSPVRAFKAVGRDPVFFVRGKGSRLHDVDGNEYVDYVGSWGPLILGHAHPAVVKALQEAAEHGTSYGAPTPLETELAQAIIAAFPSIEMVRMVNSGTEATMSALRLARGYTGRKLIIKFEGCYHGHADFLLIKAGSGALTLGVPTSPGVPEETARNTVTLPYNDLDAAARAFAELGREIAAVIIEPVAGNMGVVLPREGYLAGLRELTRRHGALLIIDEVMTGFRVAHGGAQAAYGIDPDLTTLGKIVGGGLPVGAYGGKRKIMAQVSPSGPVYQAGTLSGNPLAMTAGLETLRRLNAPLYTGLAAKTTRLVDGLLRAASAAGVPAVANRAGSMFTLFFTGRPVTDYVSATAADTARYARFFRAMLDRGVYLPPSQFEACFVSAAHSDSDLDLTIGAAEESFRELR